VTAASAEAQSVRRRFLTKLTLLISGGMFIDGFILGGIGVVMPAITEDLRLSLAWQGLIGASALIGIFIGGPLGGYLADRIGRRPMFTIDLMVFLVGSVAQFFVGDAWQLFAVRLLMGMAIGADYAIGWPLLAEFSPARVRGKLLSVQEAAWYVGFLVAYALGWALTVSELADWNVILGLSTVPTLIVLLLRLGTPESPRWLISQGRTDEAVAIAAQYMEEEEQRDLHRPPTEGKHGFARLFSRDYLKATVFVSVYWVCNTTPYFAIGTFAPSVLEHLGIEDGLTGGLALNLLACLGAFATVVLIERMGRRALSIGPLYIGAVALAVVGFAPETAPAVMVAALLVFYFVSAISSTLTGIFPAEVFPTEIRGTGVGFATAMSRVGAAVATFLFPAAIETFGTAYTLLIGAAICLFGGVITQWLAPETTGRLLSETAAPATHPSERT
jgi:putative MFS transporter